MEGKQNTVQMVGSWAFIIGVIIALIAGFWPLSTTMVTLLMVLGLIVGFLNVTGGETNNFLLAAVSLVIVANFGGVALAAVSAPLGKMFNALIIFTVPAVIIVAFKAIYALAND